MRLLPDRCDGGQVKGRAINPDEPTTGSFGLGPSGEQVRHGSRLSKPKWGSPTVVKRRMLMFKQVILASAVAGLLAGAALPLAKYGTDHQARHEYRKWCHAEWKAHKKAQKAA